MLRLFITFERVDKRYITNVEEKKRLWEVNEQWIEKWRIFQFRVVISLQINFD